MKENSVETDSALQSLSLLKATLESTADGILVVNESGQIAGYNQKFRKMWRIPKSVLLNQDDERASQYVLKQLKDPQSFIDGLGMLYANPRSNCFDELEFKDGRIYERYSIPQVMGRKIIGRVFSFRDVTDRKSMEKQLLFQATHDSLTGLPNRTLLIDRISENIKLSKRFNSFMVVALFDLNRFKGINDSLGHEAGDCLLKLVSERLKNTVREVDTFARLGGDEFVLVLSDLKNKSQIQPILMRCLRVFDTPFQIENRSITTSASMGVSIFPDHGTDAHQLLKNADSAMYSAKRDQRVSYLEYGAYMTDKAVEKLALENDIYKAIETNQFKVFYQPLFDLKTGKICGAEALLRWDHPERGMISPDKFIPLAEETGHIIPIGSWVLREVGRQIREWQDLNLPPISVAVNVSVLQFKYANFLSELEEIISTYKIKPNCLELEITETSIMSNGESFIDILRYLKKKGISLVIDDFGTGYSNLRYLNILPINKLKIDKSFIQDVSEKGCSIALSILAMAKKLNLKVVGEGVETKSQLAFLVENKCDQAQGFYFSKPIDSKAFLSFMRHHEGVENIYSNNNTLLKNFI